jgi:hypothetical protein
MILFTIDSQSLTADLSKIELVSAEYVRLEGPPAVFQRALSRYIIIYVVAPT